MWETQTTCSPTSGVDTPRRRYRHLAGRVRCGTLRRCCARTSTPREAAGRAPSSASLPGGFTTARRTGAQDECRCARRSARFARRVGRRGSCEAASAGGDGVLSGRPPEDGAGGELFLRVGPRGRDRPAVVLRSAAAGASARRRSGRRSRRVGAGSRVRTWRRCRRGSRLLVDEPVRCGLPEEAGHLRVVGRRDALAARRCRVLGHRAGPSCWVMRPFSPSTTPAASPPKKTHWPFDREAWRSRINRQRMPLSASQRAASLSRETSWLVRSGSQCSLVNRSMSAVKSASEYGATMVFPAIPRSVRRLVPAASPARRACSGRLPRCRRSFLRRVGAGLLQHEHAGSAFARGAERAFPPLTSTTSWRCRGSRRPRRTVGFVGTGRTGTG